jgi:preprotein translocase subunit SecG
VSVFEIIGSVLLFISSVLLTVVVLMQHGKDNYLGGAIAGGAAESFLGKNQARTVDTMLSRYTKIIALVFVILTIVVDAAILLFK